MRYHEFMEEDSATRSIRRMVLLFLVGDVLLLMFMMTWGQIESASVAVLAGTLIGQFGVGCAAILRNEKLREGAIGALGLLVSSAGLVPVVLNQVDLAGYMLVVTLIIVGVCLVINLVPTVIVRALMAQEGFQFSIRHIMLLMPLVGIMTLVVTWTRVEILLGIGVGLLHVAPAALGCLLVGTLSRTVVYFGCMALLALLILAGVILVPPAEAVGIFLLVQTLTILIGGCVLMRMELSPTGEREPSSAATANSLRSAVAPDPLDEP